MPLRGRAAAGTGRHWLVSMTIYAAHNKRGRQGAAAECALYALRGRAAAGTGRHWLVSQAIYAVHK